MRMRTVQASCKAALSLLQLLLLLMLRLLLWTRVDKCVPLPSEFGLHLAHGS